MWSVLVFFLFFFVIFFLLLDCKLGKSIEFVMDFYTSLGVGWRNETRLRSRLLKKKSDLFSRFGHYFHPRKGLMGNAHIRAFINQHIYDDLQRRELSWKREKSARGQNSLNCERRKTMSLRTQGSGRWYASCYTPSVQCPWTIFLFEKKQEEENSFLHRIISNASNIRVLHLDYSFPLQWSLQLNFLVARSFSLVCSCSNKVLSDTAEQSLLWVGCNSWLRHLIPISYESSLKRLKVLKWNRL